MYELIQAGSHTYYIDCPAKMGLWVEGDAAVLIDSGSDKSAAKKALHILEGHGWTLRAIINTHSHADHIGGNHTLQQQTHCHVFTPGIEAGFTRHPILEPSLLWGGYPFKELRNKFLLAQESDVSAMENSASPDALEVIPLPGHSPDMIGLRTPDNVVFLADCVSSAATLEKYRVSYLYDVESYLATLAKIENLEASLFIPAHAEATEDIAELVRLNRAAVYDIADTMLTIAEAPLTFDDLLGCLFDRYGLLMTAQQYALVGSTIRSYLSWLKDTGRMQMTIEGNRMLWQRV